VQGETNEHRAVFAGKRGAACLTSMGKEGGKTLLGGEKVCTGEFRG